VVTIKTLNLRRSELVYVDRRLDEAVLNGFGLARAERKSL
tara:strand:+ start:505 stop:624 length:120 start_codon:yes stop_codon:yes gene_type:complete